MNFLIADTFQDSLIRLTGDEQKAVKTTAFDLQLNPASPGFSFHKLDRARDKNFWSVRVNADIRIIVHRDKDSLLLCYVDHHDQAYAWAERRKLEVHPKTGAAQIVEIRETVQEVPAPAAKARPLKPASTVKPAVLANIDDEELLEFGVPAEWLADVKAADEDGILALAQHLPAEAQEAVLELAVGGKPRPVQVSSMVRTPFEHPDAQRRFRVMNTVAELRQAMEFPWDKWTVFLHPEQRSLVERDFNGPARVGGSAGTGKTIVALHRAVYLTRRYPDARVLLTTFSEPLASALKTQLRRLLASEPWQQERIDVYALDGLGVRLHELRKGPVKLAAREDIRAIVREAAAEVPNHRFSAYFVLSEWEQVVDAWQVGSWAEYRDVPRLGRKTRLPESQRQALWAIFEKVREKLAARGLTTSAAMFSALAALYSNDGKTPFDYAVVDEAQDISPAQLRVFAAIAGERPNGLFFTGDLGQRIFQVPFSWKAQGVDVRGRSRTLRVNYRTSHQIRRQADRLLNPTVADVDGNTDDRSDTVSVFNGPPPVVAMHDDENAEKASVAAWLIARAADGVLPHEFGVFVRSEAELPRAVSAVSTAKLSHKVLDEHMETLSGHVAVSTMHLAKGLEFRAVVVMACDEDILPLAARIEQAGDKADLEEVYDTERHLLYVACTRARDFLLVTAVEPGSEFLQDLGV